MYVVDGEASTRNDTHTQERLTDDNMTDLADPIIERTSPFQSQLG